MKEMLARDVMAWADANGITIESLSTKPGISATTQQPGLHVWSFTWKAGGKRHNLQNKSIFKGAQLVAELTGKEFTQ